MRPRAALALAAFLAPALAGAQLLTLGEASAPGALVVGRVCLDLDADGRCGEGDPGVAGARLLAAGGQAAIADGGGRFHLLEVPGRIVLPDRAAHGGFAIAVEGLGVRRGLELAPGGAARVEFPVPQSPGAEPPPLAPAGVPGRGPERLAGGGLRWSLGGRTTPGARVAVEGGVAEAAPDGTFAVDVELSPGVNPIGVAVTAPGGGAAAYAWRVVLVRWQGRELVIPEPPVRIAELSTRPAAGGALIAGRAAAGGRARIGGVEASPGRDGTFAGWAPDGSIAIELLDAEGRPIVRAPPPAGRAAAVFAAPALAELEISFLGGAGTVVAARGAGALRGRLGPFSVEAGVDLDDRDRRGALADLLRPRDGLVAEDALDPERSLPAGDAGVSGDRNAGRGRIWAKVEGEGARLDVGSTRTGLGDSELGRHERAIFGAKAEVERSAGPVRLEASAFGASAAEDAGGRPPPRPAHDVLGATGGASFWLSHGRVVPGSEALRIEWRDPVTGRISQGRVLRRNVDYEIDWATGRVVLAVPLATAGGAAAVRTAGPFAAPRAALVADYLHATAVAGEEEIAGGRIGAGLGPLSASLQGVTEERPEGDYRLLAAAAALDLGPALRVRAEAARSRGFLFARAGAGGFSRSPDGGFAFSGAGPSFAGEADAFHVEARGGAGPLRIEGWWREREAGYSDGTFAEAVAGRERGAAAAYGGGGPFTASLLWAERRGEDLHEAGAGVRDDRTIVARGGWRAGRLGLEAEGVHVERESPARGEETSAGVRATWEVDPSLSVDLSHHQGLRTAGAGRDPTFTAAGAVLSRGRTSLSARGGWGPEIGPRLLVGGERATGGEAVYGTFTADPSAPGLLGEPASALGVRSREGPLEIHAEERLARDAFGLRASRVLGVSAEALPGVRIGISGERGERLRLDGSIVDREALAGTASLVAGRWRLAARGELRREGGDGQAAAGASAEWRAAAGLVLGARAAFEDGSSAGREAMALDAALSAALRRADWSVHATLARLAERRPGEARRDGVVARLAATAAAGPRVDLGLGAGLALQEAGGARDDRAAGSARAAVRIAGPLDAAVEWARRASLRGEALGDLDAVRAEVGIREGESRFAVGYTFLGFGGDGLTPASDEGRLHVRLQLVH